MSPVEVCDLRVSNVKSNGWFLVKLSDHDFN